MTRNRANPTLLGAFVVAGVLLLLAGLIAAAGGSLFSRRDRVVMLFDGSTYGLQVGAPVVFRGVRLGTVATIGLLYDPASDSFRVPVVAELERNLIKTLQDQGSNSASPALGLPALVAKGLSAQLSMQSLLTGQLYVDLDLRSTKTLPTPATAHRHLAQDALEIPTTTTALQNIKNQLDTVDFRRLLDDVGAIATSARSLVAGPQLKQALDDLAQITGNVKRLSTRLDQRVDPLAQAVQNTMSAAQRALGRLGEASDRTGAAADQVGSAADQVGALANPTSPLLQRVQQTADELARAAKALRSQTADDAPGVQQLSRALQDVSQAARALRELAELLDRQPDVLLRGRGTQDTAR